MEDTILLNTIERYLEGNMLPDERQYFEQMRRNKPGIDQLVVEHKLFLEQMENYADLTNLKQSLYETHLHLLEEEAISETAEVPKTAKGKVIEFYHKYKRVTAIAASIAGITALFISMLVSYLRPTINENQLQQLYFQLNQVKSNDRMQNEKLRVFDSKIPAGSIVTSGGTAFMIDVKGYLVTNAHVLKGSGAVVVNNFGQELNARIVHIDLIKDLAILKIEDKDFYPVKTLPYSLQKTGAELGEELFTLGYPRNEIVYNMGYLSAESGFDGDTASYQISLNANPGNSGGPVFNNNGEVVGVLSTRQPQAEGVVFAVKAHSIYSILDELKQSDTSFQNIKIPSSSNIKGLNRVNQVKAAESFVYLVKAFN